MDQNLLETLGTVYIYTILTNKMGSVPFSPFSFKTFRHLDHHILHL